MSEWISVKDRLPEEHTKKFLAVTKWGHIMLAERRYGSKTMVVGGLSLLSDITHWMPLPEPPRG